MKKKKTKKRKIKNKTPKNVDVQLTAAIPETMKTYVVKIEEGI